MSMATLPILYSFRRCPYAMRARMALMVAGISVELREVDLKNKPAELLAVSPKGTVPVLLLHDGTVIDESLDIMRWAITESDPLRWGLELDCDIERRFFSEFKAVAHCYKYPDRFTQGGKTQQDYRSEVDTYLKDFDQVLAQSGFLMAGHVTFSDVALFPFYRQCRLVDTQWFDALPYAHLHQWLHHLLQAPYYELVMKKTQPWKSGESAVFLP